MLGSIKERIVCLEQLLFNRKPPNHFTLIYAEYKNQDLKKKKKDFAISPFAQVIPPFMQSFCHLVTRKVEVLLKAVSAVLLLNIILSYRALTAPVQARKKYAIQQNILYKFRWTMGILDSCKTPNNKKITMKEFFIFVSNILA